MELNLMQFQSLERLCIRVIFESLYKPSFEVLEGGGRNPRAKNHIAKNLSLQNQAYPEPKFGFIGFFFVFVSAKHKPNTQNQKDLKAFSLFLVFENTVFKAL